MSRLANYRPRRGKNHPRRTRAHATHFPNPAGSKLLRRWFKVKHETRPTAEHARSWYAGYLAAADRKVREVHRAAQGDAPAEAAKDGRMTLYVVKLKKPADAADLAKPRMVKAERRAQVEQHLLQAFTIERATPEQAAELAGDGVKIEAVE